MERVRIRNQSERPNPTLPEDVWGAIVTVVGVYDNHLRVRLDNGIAFDALIDETEAVKETPNDN